MLKSLEPKHKFTAALSGAFWSYTDFKTGKGVANHAGRFGEHQEPVDDNGVATINLSGGIGRYTVQYYVDGSKLPYDVAECGPSAEGIKLTQAGSSAGWKLQGAGSGAKLTPPDAVVKAPFAPAVLAKAQASFEVQVDGKRVQDFGPLSTGGGAVGGILDLGPVSGGKRKIAIKLLPGTTGITKYGIDATFEVSKRPEAGKGGGAGQGGGGEGKGEEKPVRLEWDVETESALKADFTLTTLEPPESQKVYFWTRADSNHNLYTLDEKGGPIARAGDFQAAGSPFSTLKEKFPGSIPLHVVAKDGHWLYTADEGEQRQHTSKGASPEGVLGFIMKEPRVGTVPLFVYNGEGRSSILTTGAFKGDGYGEGKLIGHAWTGTQAPKLAAKIKVFVDGKEKKLESPILPPGTPLSKIMGQPLDVGDGKPGTKKVAIELNAPEIVLAKWGASAEFEVTPKVPEAPRPDLAWEGDASTTKNIRVRVTLRSPEKAAKVAVLVDDMTKKTIELEGKDSTGEADLGDLPGRHHLKLVPQAVEGSLGDTWNADIVVETVRKGTPEEAALRDNEFAFMTSKTASGKFEKEFDNKGKVKVKVEYETAGGTKIEYRPSWMSGGSIPGGTPKDKDKFERDFGRAPAGPQKIMIVGAPAEDFGSEAPKDWKPIVKAGAKFKVALKAVDVKAGNPAEWGALKPGSAYIVRWNKATGFDAFGLDVVTNKTVSKSYTNANPENGEISLWGRKFKFDAQGKVTDPANSKLGQVGQIELMELAVKGKLTIESTEEKRTGPVEDKQDDAGKAAATKAKEALDKAKEGKVGIFEPGAVPIHGGGRLAFGSIYGAPKARKKMLHFEIFSPGGVEPVFDPKKDKMGWEYVDATDGEYGDVAKLLKLIDLDKDGSITAGELRKSYSGRGIGPRLRTYVIKHTSVWFVDWKAVLPKSEFWKKMMKDQDLKDAAETASNYAWWDGGLSKWDLKDKVVVHYHPLRFLQWLVYGKKAEAEEGKFHIPPGPAWKLSAAEYAAQFGAKSVLGSATAAAQATPAQQAAAAGAKK